jgi:branched-chain amino acid transport system ATP-binding protein
LFNNEEITMLDAHRIVEKGISMVPEGRHVFSKLTTLENLEMGAFTRKDRTAIQQDIEKCLPAFSPPERTRQAIRRHAFGW